MPTRWADPEAAWWAKAARARKHLDDLDVLVRQFDPATAYEIEHEPDGEPGTAALHFRVRRTVPTEILTTIGDVLHNMRSCLDSVAFELARRHVGDQMTAAQERAVQFPICETATDFDRFLSRPNRRDLYGAAERNALRCVQPFAIPEEAIGHGASLTSTPQQDFRIDQLARLSHLNNLDKHRYLPLLAWQRDWLVYFDGDVPYRGMQSQPAVRAGLGDGDLIGHVSFSDGNWEHARKIVLRMELRLADDLGYGGEFTEQLRGWHNYLVNWALQRVFVVAEGNPPPIGFFSVGA